MKKTFLILLILSVCASFFAQEKKTITVDEAVSLACQNNVTIQKQRINLNLLDKKNKTSWNSVSPTASLSAGYNPSLEENSPSTWTISASVNLSLTPSLYTAINGAKINYENGLITYDSAIRTIELNVRKLFLNLILTKENIALQQRNLETARQRYNASKEKFNRGQLSELDLLTAQYNYESLKPNLENTSISYENSLDSFKQMIGIAWDEEIELKGSLNDFNTTGDINVEYNIDEIPSIKSLKYQLENAKNNLLATRFSVWGPSLSAGYSYSLSGNDATDKTQTRNSISLGLRIPLDGYLPWSTGALNIETQKANLQTIELQYKDEKESTQINIQTKIKQIQQSKSQLKILSSNVELAQKTYNMTLTAYNHGSKDLLTLQTAADNLLKAKTNEQSQLYSLISAILDLENTLGVPFGTIK
ncbi:MAG: TolC family protein [Treponema sp.]|nr:TolC family protein [Treponema sp.]